MIYIYGSSWCVQQHQRYAWYNLLKKHYKCQIKNYSFHGVSFDWCFSKIDRTKHHWQSGDIVLFGEPHINRKWFFKRYPGITDESRILRTTRVTKEDKKFALRWKYKYFNMDLEHLQLKAHYHLMNQSLQEKNVKCYAMQGYDRPMLEDLSNVRFSKGITLAKLSNQEVKDHSGEVLLKWIAKHKSRANHFSHENHVILAQQIIKAIDTNSNIDMSVRFKRGIYERSSQV